VKLAFRAQTLGLLLALAPFCGRAETLIRLDLPQDYSQVAVREMQAELGRIVDGAGLDVRWASASSPVATVNGRIVSVVLEGRCVGTPAEAFEAGPLGWTKTANGRVLPYIEIACGRVRSALDSVWRNESDVMRELYFGKALGRVLAHELAHALTRTKRHADEGLRKRAFSVRDLVSGRFELTPSDFEIAAPPPEVANSLRAPAASDDRTEPIEINDLGR
jgi:hypothetical protein